MAMHAACHEHDQHEADCSMVIIIKIRHAAKGADRRTKSLASQHILEVYTFWRQ